jgi:hypothetical protein
MAVRIVGSRRGHRDPRPDRGQERIGRCCPTAVMGDLEQVDPGQPAGQQRRVDVLLHVPGQQEPALADDAEQHHGDVVDPAAGIRGLEGHPATDRPQHAHGDLVDRQPVAGADRHPGRCSGSREAIEPRLITRSRPTHPRLEDAAHAIPVQQQGQPRHVILVWMRQHDGIEPPVPGRDPPIELDQKPVWIGPSIDEQSAAA